MSRRHAALCGRTLRLGRGHAVNLISGGKELCKSIKLRRVETLSRAEKKKAIPQCRNIKLLIFIYRPCFE